MANLNTAVILEEGLVKPIAPAGANIYALTAPTNEGKADVYIYTPGIGASAPTLNTLFTLGAKYQPDQQIQIQDLTFGDDLSSFYGSISLGSSPPPLTIIPVNEYISDIGTSGFPTVANFVKAAFTQPAVGADVTVTLYDVTDFISLSPGDGVYVGGGTYDFVSTSGGIGGTITLTNRGLGGARVTITA